MSEEGTGAPAPTEGVASTPAEGATPPAGGQQSFTEEQLIQATRSQFDLSNPGSPAPPVQPPSPPQGAGVQPPAPAAETPPAQTQGTEGQPASAPPTTPPAAKPEEVDPLLSYGLNLIKGTPEPIEPPKEAQPWLESMGISAEDVQSIPTFKDQIAELQTTKQELDGLKEQWDRLPVQLANATQRYLKGDENWAQELTSRPTVDYNKPFEQQNVQEMVANFSTQQFSEEDWVEYRDPDGDKNVKRLMDYAIDQARTGYAETQDREINYLNNEIEQNRQRHEQIQQGIDSSMSELQKADPDAYKLFGDSIKPLLTVQGMVDRYFTPDGVPKPEAAIALLHAENHKQILDAVISAVRKDADMAAQKRLLERSGETPTRGISSAPRGDGSGDRSIKESVKEKFTLSV